MASFWLFRRASTCSLTPRVAFGAATSTAVKILESTPLFQRYRTTSSSTVAALKKQKFKKKRQQSLQLLDQYHSSHLVRILNSEIKCALDSDLLHCDVDVPESFSFKVKDIAGGRIIFLEKDFQGEAIVVKVDMPTASTTASYDAGDEEGGGVNDDRDDRPVDDDINEADHETEPSISLVITVSKGNDSCLQFDARVFPGRILVNGLSLNNSSGNSGEDGRPAYKGPDFLDLSVKFQKAIRDYLEMRGLTSSTANYLLEYMISKDTEEYLRWLKNLKKLIGQ